MTAVDEVAGVFSKSEHHGKPRADRSFAAAVGLALLLPVLSTLVTIHLPVLDRVPAALFLAAIAITAWFGYTLPTIVCIAVSMALYNYFIALPYGSWSLRTDEIVRDAVILLVASLIGWLIVRLKRTQNALLAEAARTRATEASMQNLLASYEEQNKALAHAQQAGKCAAWVMDTEKQHVRWLAGSYEIFGRPFADFEGRLRPISLVQPEDQPAVEAALRKTLETGVPFTPEFRVCWPNGEMHWQEARGNIDPDAPHILRGTTFDVTERKLAEANLLRIEKLAAMGRISHTIAHEINNPLASVINLLYLVLLEPSLPQPLREYVLTAQNEISRLSNVTRLTLSYARPMAAPTHGVDPAEIVDGVLFLFGMRLRAKSIDVVRVYPGLPFGSGGPHLVRVALPVDELQRIVTNLIANAIDAVGVEHGVIRVVVEQRGTQVVIAVEDNGVGISRESASRIFEPFFTTKPEVGTGIGLWVTKELVEKNGGSIAFTSSAVSADRSRARAPYILDLETLDAAISTRFEVRFPVLAHNDQTNRLDHIASV